MKKKIHPENYRPVVFQDKAGDFAFLTRSTVPSSETIQWEDGNEYPVVSVEISSASHPFYTGKQKFVDSAGRVEKFGNKYNWGEAAKDQMIEKAAKDRKRRVKKDKVQVRLPTFKARPEEPAKTDRQGGGGGGGGGGGRPANEGGGSAEASS